MWPNVGQTGVSGRPPRPHQAGGGAFFIIEETRQYESGDNGGAVLKPLTPHMPPRICRASASSCRNRLSLTYSTTLYFSSAFCYQPFEIHFLCGSTLLRSYPTLLSMHTLSKHYTKLNAPECHVDVVFTVCTNGLTLERSDTDLPRMQREEIVSTALIDRLGSNDDIASHGMMFKLTLHSSLGLSQSQYSRRQKISSGFRLT